MFLENVSAAYKSGLDRGSQAKKRLIATLPNSKIHSTHSKRGNKEISNRNKFWCFVIRLFQVLALGGESSVGPGFARHGSKGCSSRTAAALRRQRMRRGIISVRAARASGPAGCAALRMMARDLELVYIHKYATS